MFLEKYIELKKELNARNTIGYTAFHLACLHADSKLTDMMMKKCNELKIDLNAQDKNGQTGFHIACRYGVTLEHILIIEQILDNAESLKINLTSRNIYVRTGFQIASVMGRIEVVNLIRKKVSSEVLKKLMLKN